MSKPISKKKHSQTARQRRFRRHLRKIIVICFLLLLCCAAIYYKLAFHPRPPKVEDPDEIVSGLEADSKPFGVDIFPETATEAPLPPVDDENAQLETIICVGDSITFGAGVPLNEQGEKSYPAYLQACLNLNNRNYLVLNYGLSGRTLLSSGNEPYTAEDFYQLSMQANADIYIIMLGSNDSKKINWTGHADDYYKELKAFVEGYQDLPNHPLVILMQPPKAFPLGNGDAILYDLDDEVIRTEIHAIVARVGDETEVPVIDLYSFTESHPEWYFDGIHPDENGNREIAEYIYTMISSYLK